MTSDLLISTFLGFSKQQNGLSLIDYAQKYAFNQLLPNTTISLYLAFMKENARDDEEKMILRNLNVLEQRKDCRMEISKLLSFKLSNNTQFFTGIQFSDSHAAIPIVSEVGPMRILYLDEFPDDPVCRNNIFKLVEMFSNQINLIDQMERDQLTHLLNRKTFNIYYQSMSQKVMPDNQPPMCLAVLDIDHFKRVNDTYGHLFGDEVLLHFSQLITRNFRYNDIPFRFGGEEFVVLIDVGEADKARIALERFRQAIENYDFPGVGKVTVSIGFVECAPNKLPTTLIDQADQALYFAKENGRNQVVSYMELDQSANDDDGEIDLF